MKKIWINKNFTFLCVSALFDGAATQFSIFLFPLIAIYLYNTNVMQTSLITFVTFIPNLFLANHAGIFVDRHRKKKILLICNIISTILIFLLILLIMLNVKNIILFYFAILLSNTVRVFYTLTYGAYIPVLVQKKDLKSANVVLEIVNSFVQVIFPSLLGILTKYIALPLMTVGYGISHVLSLIGQLFIKDKEEKIIKTDTDSEESCIEEIRKSYIFVFSNELLRPIIICYIVLVFCIGIFTSVQSFYILKELGLDKSKLGLIMGIGNTGFFIGSFLTPILSKKIKPAKLILFSISQYFGGYVYYFIFNSITGLIIGQILISTAIPVYNINVVTLRQSITPIERLGSTTSIFRVCGRGLVPVGALVGGILGGLFTSRYTVLISAFIMLFSGISIICSKKLMKWE